LALSLEEQYQCLFPHMNENNWKDAQKKSDFKVADMPYVLKLKNVTGY